MLGIIIGVASVIAMIAIGQGSKQSIRDQMSSMGTNMISISPGGDFRFGVRRSSSDMQTLSLEDIDAIKENCPSIVKVSPYVSSSGQLIYGNKNWPSTMYGVSSEYIDIRKYELEKGRLFTEGEIASFAKVAIIGQTVVENLFGTENPIGKTFRFNSMPVRVIGVLTSKGENNMGMDQDDLILSPYTTVQKRILSINYIRSIYTSSVSEEATDQAIEELTAALRKSHKLKPSQQDDFSVRAQAEMVETVSSITDMMTALLGAIAGISLLVGGIGIMNIMFVSVTERTKEIGLRLSVGGRETDIMMQFLVEAIILSVSGGALGVLLGTVATKTVGAIAGWAVLITPTPVILAFAVCSVIGIFFGWYPARKASKLNPIDALRYE